MIVIFRLRKYTINENLTSENILHRKLANPLNRDIFTSPRLIKGKKLDMQNFHTTGYSLMFNQLALNFDMQNYQTFIFKTLH